jgi:UDP-N-acetylglucosamine--N-acetylmuramyl-(pentapeptide) pyrophosphoryl-undecaprenol N-acetylglucosamine transferase
MTHKVLIMAGGTGGHIFPGLAVANELIQRGWQASWLGSRGGMEESIVAKHDIECHVIEVTGVRGKGILKLVTAPFLIIKAVIQARKIMNIIKPNLVVGFGGFASGPGGIASRMLGIPLIIHEQNAVAGMTNRGLSGFADKVLVAFSGAIENAEVVGNPVRSEFNHITPKDKQSNPCRILVVGGSRGAVAINHLLPQLVKTLEETDEITVIHQVGKDRLNEVVEAYNDSQVKSKTEVLEFINDITAKYEWADVVICRAGASTVSELATSGKAAVFIPFPFAVDDHQTKNADYLVAQEAAICKQEKTMNINELARELSTLIKSGALTAMGKKAREVSHANATNKIANICEEMIRAK